MPFVFFNVALHLWAVIVDAVCSDGETIGIKPMMIVQVHLHLYVVTDAVYQVYLNKRFATNKRKDHRLMVE